MLTKTIVVTLASTVQPYSSFKNGIDFLSPKVHASLKHGGSRHISWAEISSCVRKHPPLPVPDATQAQRLSPGDSRRMFPNCVAPYPPA